MHINIKFNPEDYGIIQADFLKKASEQNVPEKLRHSDVMLPLQHPNKEISASLSQFKDEAGRLCYAFEKQSPYSYSVRHYSPNIKDEYVYEEKIKKAYSLLNHHNFDGTPLLIGVRSKASFFSPEKNRMDLGYTQWLNNATTRVKAAHTLLNGHQGKLKSLIEQVLYKDTFHDDVDDVSRKSSSLSYLLVPRLKRSNTLDIPKLRKTKMPSEFVETPYTDV